MSLGSAGNHPSVFEMDGSTPPTCILNACLAFIHCHMAVRDKLYIKGKTCSTFTLEQLKNAREQIFRFCEPDKSYGYRGPNGKSDRDKAYDAFDGIYGKLVKLDAENKMPVLSAPSSDLMSLLTISGCEHGEYDSKFMKIDEEISELKKTFHSFVSVVTASHSQPQLPKSFPPGVRSRLLSTGSKRSASEISDEDNDDDVISVLDSESHINNSEGFQLPRRQRQKQKRSRISSNDESKSKQSFSSILKKPKEKPPSTWGKAKATSSFRGAVSDIFLYNLDFDVTAKDVQDYFEANSVTIRKIERKSHEQAQRTSFRMSVATQEMYDLILEGSLLPEGVAARRFIPPKWNPNGEKTKVTTSQLNKEINSSQVQKYLRELDDIASKDIRNSRMETDAAQSTTSNNG